MKQVTIKDIAELAGVAKSTVSRYLNGGSVGKATREKLDRVIRDTNYEPNQFAQSLKSKQPKMIGVIVPRLDSYAASRTMMGIDEQLTERGYQMLVVNTAQQTEREIEQLYNLAKQKVAGIIWLGTTVTERHLEAIEAIQIPVLLIGQQHDNVHSLVYPDREAAYALGNNSRSGVIETLSMLGFMNRISRSVKHAVTDFCERFKSRRQLSTSFKRRLRSRTPFQLVSSWRMRSVLFP